MNKRNDPSLGPDTSALLSNGLNFLNRAREELEEGHVMFSIVSFWTAVEILLKVPLVHEHWTLVCSGKKLERRKYLDGNFQSVSYDDACARLGDVLEKPLSEATMKTFDKVRRHRNRVVHFYHNAASEEDLRQIRTEQGDAWFALNRLMRDEWKPLFGPWLSFNLAKQETLMLRSNKFYAEAKFRSEPVQDELNRIKKTDLTVGPCGICGQPSLIHEVPVPGMRFTRFNCLVCHAVDSVADICCTRCNEINSMRADDQDFECGKCGLKTNRYDALETSNDISECKNSVVPAGCVSCMDWESVCRYGGKYLCSSCFDVFDSLQTCERCFHISSRIPENSFEDGCHFC